MIDHAITVPAGASELPTDAFLDELAAGVLALAQGSTGLTVRFERGVQPRVAAVHALAVQRVVRTAVKAPVPVPAAPAAAPAPNGHGVPPHQQFFDREQLKAHIARGFTPGCPVCNLARLVGVTS